MDKNSIGHNIRIARTIAGLTQRELADKLEITWEMVSRYETNKVSPLSRIKRISEILGTTVSFLVGETNKILNDPQNPFQNTSGILVPFITNPKKTLFTSKRKANAVYPTSSKIKDISVENSFAISTNIITDFKQTGISKNGVIVVMETSKYNPEDIVLYSDIKTQRITFFLDMYKHIIHDIKVKIHGKIILFEKHFD